jgi:hypothetical protein
METSQKVRKTSPTVFDSLGSEPPLPPPVPAQTKIPGAAANWMFYCFIKSLNKLTVFIWRDGIEQKCNQGYIDRVKK